MYLITHGGGCCGIKTIYNLPVKPMDKIWQYSIDVAERVVRDDGCGSWDHRNKAVTWNSLPTVQSETGEARLIRFLAELDKYRKKGIVEIVTSSSHMGLDQTERWKDTLEKYGFKAVNSCKNSNSGAEITVWHRNSGEVPVVKMPKDKKEKVKGAEQSLRAARPWISTAVGE